MASNPYVNKVQLADGTTLIDISDTTAVASDVASGKYFYTASGTKTAGTASGGGSVIITDTQDAAGGTIRTITSGSSLTLTSLSATSNQTYTAPSGTAYNEVVVNVSGGGGGGLEYETGIWSPTTDTLEEWIPFANSHTTPPMYVAIVDTNVSTLNGSSYSDSTYIYCCIADFRTYGGISGNTVTCGVAQRHQVSENNAKSASNTTLTTGAYSIPYYLTNTQFKPNQNNNTVYWRANRTYKWVAVWPPTT